MRVSGSSFKATSYDKIKPTRKLDAAMKEKLGIQTDHHTDDAVLGDLLVTLLSKKSYLILHSDFELYQGYSLYEKLFTADKRCHEAMFGLAKVNYAQGRYEIAEKLLIKAYQVKRDFVYRVWLGYCQMQLFRVCTEMPNKLRNA